jgi:hypothetical protein
MAGSVEKVVSWVVLTSGTGLSSGGLWSWKVLKIEYLNGGQDCVSNGEDKVSDLYVKAARMSRKRPVAQETSTEIASDISFMNRQKELRSLYRDFRSTIDTIQLAPPSPGSEDDEYDEAEEPYGISNDLELLLGELEIMQTETDEIVALLGRPKFAKHMRVNSIRKQLHHLQTVNAHLRSRAEALLDVA